MRAAPRLAPAVVLLVVAAASTVAAAPGRPHIELMVRLDVARRTVSGHMTATISNTGPSPLDHLELWRYPARLGAQSPALDEHNFYWQYPNRFDAGAMSLGRVTVDGEEALPSFADHPHAGPGTLVVVPLRAPLPPGASARLEIDFDTRVPYRYGSFGCYRDGCTLAGGFYPMPLAQDEGGFDRGAPPARADLDVTVDTAAPALLVDGAAAQPGQPVHVEDAAFALVVAGPRFEEASVEHRGVRIVYHHHGGRPPGRLDLHREKLALDDVREAVEMMHELGLDLPAGEEIRLVDAPLRMELANAQAHAVLVSDQIYRIFPINRFRKFHSFQLVGAVFDCLLEARLSARERPADLAFSPDVAAAWLVDLYTLRIYRRQEFARDILRWVSFIPAIDRILYAPMIPFATAYFNTVDEPDPTRDDLHRFMSDWPRGKLIHEKLRDLVGDRGMTAIMQSLWAGTPVREAAEAEAHGPLEHFFAQWLGPYPDVDYRFTILRRDRTRTGHRYHVRLDKRGDHAPEEPVELKVTEWGGATQTVRWDGRGRDNTFTLETRHLLRSVVLDPRGRLRQRIAGENVDHRLDDSRPAPVKLIYNNFGALFNVQTLALDLSLDFSILRIHDLKNTARLVLYHNEAVLIGGLIGYARGFGRKILPSRLSSAVSGSLRVARLDSGFANFGGPPQPGTRITASLGVGYDDRFFIWEPWTYTQASAAVSYSATILDDRRVFQQVTASGRMTRAFPLAQGHGLAMEGAVAATFGDLRLPSQALFVGGPSGELRGYEPDELPGRSWASLRLEYRHTFVRDLDWNLLWLFYIRGFAGGAFAEAAVISPCDAHLGTVSDAAHGFARNLYGDVGYSLRVLGDFFGVSQSVFNVDVAVPLRRQERTCFPAPDADPPPLRNRFPVGISVYFGPVW